MSRIPRSLTLWLLLALATPLDAQFVIPDWRFRDRLLEVVPNAVNGDTLLVNHPDVLALTSLTVGSNCVNCVPPNPTDIDGIQHFVNLEFLSISFCEISTCPPLPNKIRTLLMDYIPYLFSVSSWPDSARHISAKHDYYWDGPSNLQPIPALPPYLEYLDLYAHLLDSLPPIPPTLVELRMDRNDLTQYPALPNTLRHLNLRANEIPYIPAFPDSLRYLDVGGLNPLTALPPLPSRLEQFHCAVMYQLTEIPELPPTLQVINTSNTPITCYPYVPPTVTSWDLLAGTLCIPNRPPFLTSGNAMTKPVCSIITTSCDYFSSATGTLFHDDNGNGLLDPGEPPFSTGYVLASPGGNLAGPGSDGHYFMPLDSGTHTLSAVAPPWYMSTTPDQQVQITAPFQIDSLRHFGFQPAPGVVDLWTDLFGINAPPRPGFAHRLRLIVRNNGTQITSGTAMLQFDPADTWVSSSPLPATQAGNTATWTVPPLLPGEELVLTVELLTSANTPLGSLLAHQFSVTADDPEQLLDDNSADLLQAVMGSYDPNDKQVVPEFMGPDQVQQGELLTYTIRFQNTGTFLAERVVITDTLSTDLLWSSLQVIDASHPFSWFMDEGVLHFVFDGILLPDSTSNEPESHGHVRFRMAPRPTLQVGAQVINVANIHFDFNAPVITAPSVFTVTTTTTAPEATMTPALQLMPNPARTDLLVRADMDLSGSTVRLLTPDGRVLRSLRVAERVPRVDVHALAAGTYLLELMSPLGDRFVERFHKE